MDTPKSSSVKVQIYIRSASASTTIAAVSKFSCPLCGLLFTMLLLVVEVLVLFLMLLLRVLSAGASLSSFV